ncbi:permeases of the drug/metabolite transporter (DMT) superfamily [Clostridium aceticum]|uniref:Permeases of the drug/metabolite transporter (DMT) superfamily n=1 Tax=Clostridium aceticum TaxID=84022 RepID=A0A0D8IDI8_9CLOT|nr:DMT family transporter [Clostridium aceticum]AKL94447.1 permeases of the drug/metabolite transporter (DMT) superfamily [Clostridium aceticum]KJF28333.1 hypothetical protein TZ02_02900 [Clostridium aceticum]
MENKENMYRVHVLLFIAVIGVSFSAILIKNTAAPASIIAMYRMLITFFLFLPVALIKGKKEIQELVRKDFLLCCVSGLFLALHFITWMTSLKYTTVVSSTVLVGLQPIFTAIIGYMLFKERLSKKGFLGMLMAIGGSSMMGFLSFHAGRGHLYGNILALLGAFFGALYIIIGRGIRKKISTLTYGFIAYGTCSLFLVIMNIVLKLPFTGYTPKDYTLFFGMAVLCTIGGHTIFNWALKYIEANKIATTMLGEPVGATFLAVLLLKEIPSLGQILSGIFILSGLYIFMGTDKEKTEPLVTYSEG